MVWPLRSDPGGMEVEVPRDEARGSWLALCLSKRSRHGYRLRWSQEENKDRTARGRVEAQLFPPLEKLPGAHGFRGGSFHRTRAESSAVHLAGTRASGRPTQGFPICRADPQHWMWRDATDSDNPHLSCCPQRASPCLPLQEVANTTGVGSADFGLSISGIHKGSGEENVRPHKVGASHEPNT